MKISQKCEQTIKPQKKCEPEDQECEAPCCFPLYRRVQAPAWVSYVVNITLSTARCRNVDNVIHTLSALQDPLNQSLRVLTLVQLHVGPLWMAGLCQSCRPLSRRRMHSLLFFSHFVELKSKQGWRTKNRTIFSYFFLMGGGGRVVETGLLEHKTFHGCEL